MNNNMTASVRPLASIQDTGNKWRSIESHATSSFFQSWKWIGTWLEALPPDTGPALLTLEVESRVVGIGVLVQRKISRKKRFSTNCLFLNESGLPSLDALTIEDNDILIVKGVDRRTCIENMLSMVCRDIGGWDEFIISGVNEKNIDDYIYTAGKNNLNVKILDKKPYYYVDLQEIRTAGKDYLDCLSSNTRQQLRRSIKAYGGNEAITISQPEDADEAIYFYDELKKLHQSYWEDKGHSGAFSDDIRDSFHKRLIINGIPDGAVQLLKISTDKNCIGYLYNFVNDGIVSNYQGGFVYQDKPVFRPGMISHYMAIQYNTNNGMNIYDFLAGNHRYKKSLSTTEAEMYWLSLQKSKIIFKIENALKKLSHFLRIKAVL